MRRNQHFVFGTVVSEADTELLNCPGFVGGSRPPKRGWSHAERVEADALQAVHPLAQATLAVRSEVESDSEAFAAGRDLIAGALRRLVV